MSEPQSSKVKISRRAKAAAKVFISFGAQEVYLFGSRATGTAKRGSDFDFAIRGVPARDFYRAAGEVFTLLRMPVDVVDLDEDSPFIRYLQAHGAMVRIA
jgi:predicted nucleotidyltransferase